MNMGMSTSILHIGAYFGARWRNSQAMRIFHFFAKFRTSGPTTKENLSARNHLDRGAAGRNPQRETKPTPNEKQIPRDCKAALGDIAKVAWRRTEEAARCDRAYRERRPSKLPLLLAGRQRFGNCDPYLATPIFRCDTGPRGLPEYSLFFLQIVLLEGGQLTHPMNVWRAHHLDS